MALLVATASVLTAAASPASAQCGLTLRSRRGPTASRQAREAVGHIIRLAGLASCRRSRLTSNVRRQRQGRPRRSPTIESQSAAHEWFASMLTDYISPQ
jgi:hypothetical protein